MTRLLTSKEVLSVRAHSHLGGEYNQIKVG